MGRGDIEELLRANVQQATTEYEAAKRNFWQVCSDVPSGIPHPDGARRLQRTAYAQNIAMQALASALHRLNAFLIDGTIPDDLPEDLLGK